MTTPVVNSADSHVIEPGDLWSTNLPRHLRTRGPRTVRQGEHEIVYVDGQALRRDPVVFIEAMRPPGTNSSRLRLLDLDDQGVWGELLFPSTGIWTFLSEDGELQAACTRVYNEWLVDEFMAVSPRFVPLAALPVIEVADTIGELHRAADRGFKGAVLPVQRPRVCDYNSEEWHPFWDAVDESGLHLAFHVGTGSDPKVTRGPGGALVNYVETSYGVQRVLSHLVGAGVLENHPNLHVLLIEGGASWLPSMMERMDEAQRQFGNLFNRPHLPLLPSQYIRRQVHASFQHGRAILSTLDITGTDTLLWGSDYPHIEGTYPNTQAALDEVFEGAAPDVRRAVAGDNLARLFDIPPPPPGRGATCISA